MRKNVFGRQFKRDKNERKALFKSLLTSLVLYERIQTTEAKAKSIKADADKLITTAKKGGLHAYRMLAPEVSSIAAVKKLLNTIAPRFANRQGGYTRIIRVGTRLKDNAPQVILEWTEKAPQPSKEVKPAQAKQEKPAENQRKSAINPRKSLSVKKGKRGKDK